MGLLFFGATCATCLVVVGVAVAVPPPPEPIDPRYLPPCAPELKAPRPTSMPRLEGDLCSVELFFRHGSHGMTTTEKEMMRQGADDGRKIVAEEAKRYGVDVRLHPIVLDGDVHIPGRRATTCDAGAMATTGAAVAKGYGFASLGAVVAEARRREPVCKSVQLIFMSSGCDSQSECRNETSCASEVGGVRLAVVNDIPLGGIIAAHEMLHLYGAWDLYSNASLGVRRSPDAQAELDRIAADDIMNQGAHVTPLTAWLVGWPVCGDPRWNTLEPSGMGAIR